MTETIAPDLFLAMHDAIQAGIMMIPRSRNDKEYFPQDWFAEQASKVPGLELKQQGRNSYPDFWAKRGNIHEGYEIKSLAFIGGKPARKDLDFNSTVPSGLKSGHPVFLLSSIQVVGPTRAPFTRLFSLTVTL